MKVFPAIDIIGGKVVSLEQGDFQRLETFSNDPVLFAESFVKQGASNLHMVDLDGARTGQVVNLPIVKKIAEETGMFIQIGGGIRDEERINAYLEAGVSRVILGSIAARNFQFAKDMIAKYKEKIAIGVDAKNDVVAVDGWADYVNLSAIEFCKKLDDAGAHTIIYTDIAKDGMLSGSNLGAYKTLKKECKHAQIIASGGITSMEEVKQLSEIGVEGMILGKAIYTGRLNLREVLENVN